MVYSDGDNVVRTMSQHSHSYDEDDHKNLTDEKLSKNRDKIKETLK